jgi:hypothetical protein
MSCAMHVMYFYHKTSTICIVVKTIWIIIDLYLELELSLFCCVNVLYVTSFRGSSSGEAAKIGVI